MKKNKILKAVYITLANIDMNTVILTGRIINQPKLLRYKKKAFTQIVICVPNNKKGLSFYNIKAGAKGKIGSRIFDIYRKGDFIIIEGLITIKSKKISINNKYVKIVKSVNIKVNRIHPASLIFT
uniref:putative single-stranded DNA-binding protein Ycf41 n=1 Tax=Anunuuluaehu liula TaxID=3049639 RepID=UPI003001DACC